MLRCFLLLGCLIAYQPFAFAQEKARKTETISTASKLIAAKLDAIEVKGIAMFTLAAVSNDGTLTGNLVFTLPDVERQKIAQSLNKPLTEIPAYLAASNFTARFEKNTHCPDLRLVVTELKLEVAGSKLHFNRFILTFPEGPQRLARALCIWTDRTNKGVVNTGIVQYINLLLKGEEDEEQAK